ncbi:MULTISPECIES: glycosyltransferase family 2 protein [Aphanothece]|uniref:glycosyltransferase family 2 protein n=1 Tax=Aphanothece TaxID=1121 RepID=UPI0039849EBA
MTRADDISIVIPTYGREAVLVDTLRALMAQPVRAADIIVVDQTPQHEPQTVQSLQRWSASGELRHVFFAPPSIPRAMNLGLLLARTPYVLFLDDDIVPAPAMVASLAQVLNSLDARTTCVAGQVLQPGEAVIPRSSWRHSWFPFNSAEPAMIDDVMAGNLCVHRESAIHIGGFDENFRGAALRFESEFARRVRASGATIEYRPEVSMHHLRAERGGTRAKGTQLTTWRPHHSVGKYYFAFLGGLWQAFQAVLVYPLRSIRTHHHLAAPWWIPATLLAELLGMGWAAWLRLKGPRHVDLRDPVALGNLQ